MLIIQMHHDLSALLLASFDMAGTAVFATSGALAAARARQTPLTFAFFSVVTGVGGSTLSELLMGAPVTWVHHPTNIVVCLFVAVLTWITPLAWWPRHTIDWFDAVGLAAYGAVGAANALTYNVPPLSAAIMGVFTACLGGVFRDVLAGEPSIIVPIRLAQGKQPWVESGPLEGMSRSAYDTDTDTGSKRRVRWRGIAKHVAGHLPSAISCSMDLRRKYQISNARD